MAETFLWNFIKIQKVVSEKKMFKEKVNTQTDAWTDYGQQTMTYAHWPMASGAENKSSLQENYFFNQGVLFLSLNPFPHNDAFWRPWETSLLKTLWEKEKLLVTSNFSFSHSVFYPFGELSAIFVKFEIVVCKLFQFGRV